MSENEAKETMQDFEAELEASFRKINEGDILTVQATRRWII